MCLVNDVMIRRGITERRVFHYAAIAARFTNYDEVAETRYFRWLTKSEVPTWVQEWCLKQLEERCPRQSN